MLGIFESLGFRRLPRSDAVSPRDVMAPHPLAMPQYRAYHAVISISRKKEIFAAYGNVILLIRRS